MVYPELGMHQMGMTPLGMVQLDVLHVVVYWRSDGFLYLKLLAPSLPEIQRFLMSLSCEMYGHTIVTILQQTPRCM